MLSYNNIVLIGTSHISIESIQEVTSYINKNKPAIIALELDKPRLHALFHKQKPSIHDLRHIGIKGFLITLIGHYIESKLGKLVGVSPGDEMKAAALLAKQHKLKLALIDQPINITLKKLSKQLTKKEIFRFFIDILTSIITRKPKIQPFDLKKTPPKAVINQLLSHVKARYPTIYKVLLQERNAIMAKNLYTLATKYPQTSILAIMGAGHQEDVIKTLKRIQDSNNNNPSPHNSI
ncbi:MAG TPA: TraB/GumN family protein [Candidatus Nanoarchaeia archaeon]|nr:TraB/GumN family protein [Candidatus Nanoarchaeia archaeon]